MTDALRKLYVLRDALSGLVSCVDEPKRWQRYQDYCDEITNYIRELESKAEEN